MKPIGKTISDNKSVYLDIQRILEGRMLLQANSGGGKSYAVRKLCEITHGKVQHILLDLEGEFATLREKFDYILIGKDGDIPINVKSAELLAHKILELGVSAIIDLYELKHNERKKFVKLFLDSLINAPKNLWHPCFVIIDEAHVVAPESAHGQAESLDSVKDLATRGRKRGFALIAATQRLSKLSKDVVAELNTKLIGRSSLDVDMKRAGFELGFTTKDDLFTLRQLEKGEFYAFGAALTPQVTKIKIGLCETTHPKAGKVYKQSDVPPPEKIKNVLKKLTDLPKEAEKEIKTKEDMQKKIIELKRELATERKRKSNINPDDIKKAEINGYNKAQKQFESDIKKIESQIKQYQNTLQQVNKLSAKSLGINPTIVKPSGIQLYIPGKAPKFEKKYDNSPYKPTKQFDEIPDESDNDIKLRHGAMRMLKVVAMFYPNEVTKQQIGTMAGFSIKGGTFNTYLSDLKKNELIIINGENVTITEYGLKLAGNVDPLPTDPDAILDLWCSKFRDGVKKMLREIASVYPNSITKEDLGERTGFSVSGGTFNTYLSEIKRNGLIVVDGDDITASKELFPLN